MFAAVRAGACGYVLKGARQDETLRAIRAVANGEVIFGPGVAQRVVRFFNSPKPAELAPTFPQLTAREYEILELIAQRCGNAEIAARLVLSPKNRTQLCVRDLEQAARGGSSRSDGCRPLRGLGPPLDITGKKNRVGSVGRIVHRQCGTAPRNHNTAVAKRYATYIREQIHNIWL